MIASCYANKATCLFKCNLDAAPFLEEYLNTVEQTTHTKAISDCFAYTLSQLKTFKNNFTKHVQDEVCKNINVQFSFCLETNTINVLFFEFFNKEKPTIRLVPPWKENSEKAVPSKQVSSRSLYENYLVKIPEIDFISIRLNAEQFLIHKLCFCTEEHVVKKDTFELLLWYRSFHKNRYDEQFCERIRAIIFCKLFQDFIKAALKESNTHKKTWDSLVSFLGKYELIFFERLKKYTTLAETILFEEVYQTSESNIQEYQEKNIKETIKWQYDIFPDILPNIAPKHLVPVKQKLKMAKRKFKNSSDNFKQKQTDNVLQSS